MMCAKQSLHKTEGITSEIDTDINIRNNSPKFHPAQKCTIRNEDRGIVWSSVNSKLISIEDSSDEGGEILTEDHLWEEIHEAMKEERVKMESHMNIYELVHDVKLTNHYHKEDRRRDDELVSNIVNVSANIQEDRVSINLSPKESIDNFQFSDDGSEGYLDLFEPLEAPRESSNKSLDNQSDELTKNGICKDFSRYKFCLRGPKCSHKHLTYDGKIFESSNKHWMQIDSEEKMRKVRRMLADKMFCRNYLKKRLCKDGTVNCLGLHCAQSDADKFRLTGDLPDQVWKQAADKWARNNKITWYARLPELFGSSSICIAYIRANLDEANSGNRESCERFITRSCNYRHVSVEKFAQELGFYLRGSNIPKPIHSTPQTYSPKRSSKQTTITYPYPPPPIQVVPSWTPIVPIVPQAWVAVPYWPENVQHPRMNPVSHANIYYNVIGF